MSKASRDESLPSPVMWDCYVNPPAQAAHQSYGASLGTFSAEKVFVASETLGKKNEKSARKQKAWKRG